MGLIRLVIDIYILVLVASVVLSYFPHLRHHPVVMRIHQASELTCKPIRKLLPPDLPFDFSPILVIIALRVLVFLF